MRSPQKSNRARGRGNRKGNGGNNVNRVYESNGPEGKVRGTAQQIIDKYLTLARDAQTSSDRVGAENFLQHAEHYQRVLALALGQQQERRDQQPQSDQGDDRDDDDMGYNDSPQQQQPQQQRRAFQATANEGGPEGQDRAEAASASSDGSDGSGVSGMQTIDAGDDNGPELIVTPEEVARSRPRRRRNSAPRTQRSGEGGENETSPEAHAAD